jgi:hypothetical protein
MLIFFLWIFFFIQVVKFVNKFVKSSPAYDGDKFFTMVDGVKVLFFFINSFFENNFTVVDGVKVLFS